MRKIRRLGFISIELVIIASIVMAAGLAGIISLGGKGNQLAQNGTNKVFDLLNWGGKSSEGAMVYDAYGYPKELNINPGDISSTSDFAFAYNDSLNGWTITSHLNQLTDTVVIPSVHDDGRPIVEIGVEAFNGMDRNTKLVSVAIPNSMKSIKDYAFMYNWIDSIVLPDSLTILEEGLFYVNPLTSAYIPNSVKEIKDHVFAFNQLTTVKIPGSVEHIGASAFQNNELASVTLSEGLRTIGAMAFEYNKIESLTLPSTLEFVEFYAFSINRIKSLVIPKSLKIIDSQAFAYNELVSLTILEGVETIAYGAFAFNNLTSVEFPSSLKEMDGDVVGNQGITSVVFRGAPPVLWSPGYAFASNTDLGESSISVPLEHLASYQANAGSFGVAVSAFVGQ